jgi:hypothetical protein
MESNNGITGKSAVGALRWVSLDGVVGRRLNGVVGGGVTGYQPQQRVTSATHLR